MNQAEELNSKSPKGGRSRMTSRLIHRLIMLPILAILGMYFLSMTSAKPSDLGVQDGAFSKCPPSPNCVSTQSDDPKKTMPAIGFTEDAKQTLNKIKATIESNCPRAKLITETDNYLHYEFTSLVFRFVDDVEFFANDSERLVHFRSASRVGHSDLGANGKRMKKICESLKP